MAGSVAALEVIQIRATLAAILYPRMSADGQFEAAWADDALVQQTGDGNEDVFLLDLREASNVLANVSSSSCGSG